MKILQINSETLSDNAEVGGKCASLIRLMQLGMVVPDGMVITTSAYGDHAKRCGLNEKISPLIKEQDWAGVDRTAIEGASTNSPPEWP